MTRDKAGQAFVPGFLAAVASTPLATEGNLPGGPGLFDLDRMRTGLERTPDQAALFGDHGGNLTDEPCDCPRCTGAPPCPDCDGDGAAPPCPTCGKGVKR